MSEQKMIRFITPDYQDIFYLPDGKTVKFDFKGYSNGNFVAKCAYLDPTHVSVNGDTWHIAELAERLEINNGTCYPEPIIEGEESAWKIGIYAKYYILIQKTFPFHWYYVLYNNNFEIVEDGTINAKTMNEVREAILDKHGLLNCSRIEMNPKRLEMDALRNNPENKTECYGKRWYTVEFAVQMTNDDVHAMKEYFFDTMREYMLIYPCTALDIEVSDDQTDAEPNKIWYDVSFVPMLSEEDYASMKDSFYEFMEEYMEISPCAALDIIDDQENED